MVELRDYQRAAIEKLKTGSILCGGVGSGKSRTSLAYYFYRECDCPHEDAARDLYIITTARKRDTGEWEEELAPFGLKAAAIDSWNNIKKYVEVKDAFFIFDEQRVVGYGAWTKAFLRITKQNDWILLSATPGDTWMDYIPVFIANGFYRSKTDFCDQHVIWSRFSKFPQVKGYINQGKLIRLRNDILVRMDYRRPTEVHHEIILVEYDSVLYRIVQNKRWDPYENKPIENVSQCCYLLRKIVNSDESRLAALADLLRSHPKAIIFYRYDFELELMKEQLRDSGLALAEWNGHKHEPIPTGERWAYLVQYTSGCEGWNCVETDTMIFYSDDYSYKVMVQAAGRIDRMNTPFTDLYYYHLRSTAPIDRAIDRALRAKKSFNESRFLGERLTRRQELGDRERKASAKNL